MPAGSLLPPDQLYVGTTFGWLYRVDSQFGDTTLVGIAPGVKYTALAFNPRTGDLWAADYSGTRDIIVKVNPLTADTQFVGRTGDGLLTLSLSFDDRGSLFALKSAGLRNLIVRVDTATGTGSLVDTLSVTGIFAMTMNPFIVSVPTPELPKVPVSFHLEQNFPNPFNPSTTIRYDLPNRAQVTLTVFNMLGQRVATLVQGEQEAGYHEAVFDARDLASGVYVYRLWVRGTDSGSPRGSGTGEYVQSKKLVLIR
jgi:DNA-binding beta-propeller fold protein YncE